MPEQRMRRSQRTCLTEEGCEDLSKTRDFFLLFLLMFVYCSPTISSIMTAMSLVVMDRSVEVLQRMTCIVTDPLVFASGVCECVCVCVCVRARECVCFIHETITNCIYRLPNLTI